MATNHESERGMATSLDDLDMGRAAKPKPLSHWLTKLVEDEAS